MCSPLRREGPVYGCQEREYGLFGLSSVRMNRLWLSYVWNPIGVLVEFLALDLREHYAAAVHPSPVPERVGERQGITDTT